MTSILKFIASHSTWFYLLFALAFGVIFSALLRAQQSRQEALFGLELEMALSRQRRAGRLVLVPLVLIALVFAITNYVVPDLPAGTQLRATATVDYFATPPPTFTNITPTATATLTPTLIVPTLTQVFAATAVQDGTPGAEETETPTPEPLPTIASGAVCIINEPAEGSQVSGEVVFVGSATVDNFQFYKLEAYGPETNGVWASIIGDVARSPVINGVLGAANFSGWAPGGYSVRVVVVDNTSNEVAGCFVSITVGN